MITIGIDPGLTGCIAFVDSRGSCVLADIPTMALPGNGLVKRKVDGLALARMVRTHCPAAESTTVVCEAVRTMGGKNNAVQTQGSLMRSLGAIETVFEVLRFPWQLVEPRKWKDHYGLMRADGETESAYKRRSIDTVLRIYPMADITLAKHHNRAEALLIAHWGQAHLT